MLALASFEPSSAPSWHDLLSTFVLTLASLSPSQRLSQSRRTTWSSLIPRRASVQLAACGAASTPFIIYAFIVFDIRHSVM